MIRNEPGKSFEDTKQGRILHMVFLVIFLPLLLVLSIILLRNDMREVLNENLETGSRVFSGLCTVFYVVWCCFLVVLLMRSTRRIFGRRAESPPAEEVAGN
jgi:hypothetical protein